MRKIKISVIGTSWITEAFLSAVVLNKGFILDAVLSRTRERGNDFAAKNGLTRTFTLLGDLCDSDTDCVYVASPNLLHYEQCKALLLSGKHIICEKPISVSLKEYSELVNIAQNNSLIFIEAIMYMHTPSRTALRQAVTKIGIIYSAHFDYSQLSSKYRALLQGKNPNIFNPSLKTGSLNDLGVYCVYPALDLFSYPEKITAKHHRISTGADGCGSSLFEYTDKLVTITYSKVGQSRGVSQIIGDKGTITIESISQLTGISLFDNKGRKTIISRDMTKTQLMGYEAQIFYNFITNPDKNNERLLECVKQAENVVRAMEEMRAGYSISISQ
jgi:predicted dehydrogenase